MKKNIAKSISLMLLAGVMAMGLIGCGNDSGKAEKEDTSEKKESGTEIKKNSYKEMTDEEKGRKGTYETAEDRIADMQLITEDEQSELYLDVGFAEFAVRDKKTGETWFSNPYNLATDTKAAAEAKKDLQSLVTLTYYDSKDAELSMNSFSDCMAKDQYTVEKLEHGFAVHMQMGRVDERVLAPEAIEASKYEELIIPNVSEREAIKLKAYYTKVSLLNDSLSESVKNKYLKSTPGLSDHDFYILRETTDREKKVLEEILLKSEYDYEDMDDDLALSGHVVKKNVEALFNMSLYVELENGDLRVSVPAESISYDEKNFYLASFQVLKYFGAGKYDQDGYLFIPDGSGALIYYNNDGVKNILHTTNTVYGMDYALSFDYGMNSLSEQIHFPVYGNKENNKAMLAVIEEGSSLASIITESGNILTSYETVYPQFSYVASHTVNYTDSTKIKGLYTYHDTNHYEGDYTIRYSFLTGEKANYVGMAEDYQEYLVENKVLTKLDEDSKSAFYVETLGALEKTSTKFGVPYTESVALTSFEQAEDILKEIQAVADLDLKLRYKGWANGGLYYTVSNKVKIEKSLGGKKGFADLEKFTVDNGIAFYPDVDFFMTCEDGFMDGYREAANSAHNIRKEVLYLVNPQGFTNFAEFQYLNYSVSPYYFKKYMKEYFSSYDKLGMAGVSVGNAGTMLYAEYQRSKTVNREDAMNIVAGGLKEHTQNYNLMVDGGNAYTLPYASDIANVPMYNSSHTLEDESVPFMQLVLHGYKQYSGEAINLTGEYEDMFLKSIEYGSNPFFTVAADNEELLSKTSMSYYTSVKWDALKDEIKTSAKEWAEAYEGLADQKMIAHKKINDDVYATTYEDGTMFYVNYGETEWTSEDGVTVSAKDYTRVTK